MSAASPLPPSLKKLHSKIAELKGKKYLPEAMVNVITEVALLQRAAEDHVCFDATCRKKSSFAAQPSEPPEPPLLPQEILNSLPPADAHAQGAFLLARESFPLDMNVARDLVPAILRAIMECAPDLNPLAGELQNSLTSGECSLDQACRTALGDLVRQAAPDTCFSVWATRHPDAPEFFRFVIQSAIMPSVIVAARLLGAKHKVDTWNHGTCPICGSLPLMGRLMENEGIRMHTCSFCTFEYRVPRIGCPFCAEDPAGTTEYYSSEEEPGYQINVCNACRNYIKIADFRKYDRIYLPMLDDLASLTLDLYARQMGYTRPTLSAWGF